ncbi:MAG TPA: hypothetical protein VFE47_05185 [Tepidisphaeraceae bacterium]|jgi:hypothetical protein|nr:hypothetical protein [Tepidisphaeraceae bacterium]
MASNPLPYRRLPPEGRARTVRVGPHAISKISVALSVLGMFAEASWAAIVMFSSLGMKGGDFFKMSMSGNATFMASLAMLFIPLVSSILMIVGTERASVRAKAIVATGWIFTVGCVGIVKVVLYLRAIPVFQGPHGAW